MDSILLIGDPTEICDPFWVPTLSLGKAGLLRTIVSNSIIVCVCVCVLCRADLKFVTYVICP